MTSASTNASVSNGELLLIKKNDRNIGARVINTVSSGLVDITHFYYLRCDMKDIDGTCYMHFSSDGAVASNTVIQSSNTAWERRGIVTKPKGSNNKVCLRVGSSTTPEGKSGYFKNAICIDLTATFGAGNEPTLAECEAMFTDDYYPYYVPAI